MEGEGALGVACIQTPREDQLEDFTSAINNKRFSDFSEVGTGKSLKSYLYILHHLLEGRKVVVVMPPPLIPQYITEFERIFPGQPFQYMNFNVPLKKRNRRIHEGIPELVFMSYQMFVKYSRKLTSHEVLVADEAHALKSESTTIFRVVQQHLHTTDGYFLEMTATPCKVGLHDAYGHIRLKFPREYRSYNDFERKHISYALVAGYKKIVGYREKAKLSETLNRCSARRLSSDVLDLDKPNLIEHHIDIEEEHRAIYTRFMRELFLEIGDELITALNSSSLRQHALRIVTQVEKYTEGKVVDAPLENLMSIIDSLDLKKTKLLIFCHFRDTVEKLQELLEGYNPAVIYGGSNTKRNAEKFLTDDTCRVCIPNYKSGGAGFNFQSVCHNIIMYEPVGVPAELAQAIGRCHRGGQTEVVNVWVFNYYRTLFSRMVDTALERDVEIKTLMGDRSTVLEALYLPPDLIE